AVPGGQTWQGRNRHAEALGIQGRARPGRAEGRAGQAGGIEAGHASGILARSDGRVRPTEAERRHEPEVQDHADGAEGRREKEEGRGEAAAEGERKAARAAAEERQGGARQAAREGGGAEPPGAGPAREKRQAGEQRTAGPTDRAEE